DSRLIRQSREKIRETLTALRKSRARVGDDVKAFALKKFRIKFRGLKKSMWPSGDVGDAGDASSFAAVGGVVWLVRFVVLNGIINPTLLMLNVCWNWANRRPLPTSHDAWRMTQKQYDQWAAFLVENLLLGGAMNYFGVGWSVFFVIHLL